MPDLGRNMSTFTRLLIALVLSGFLVSSAAAQFPNSGKLNAWTTRPVSRRHGAEATYVQKIRVGRHQAFDRVVFEFSGSMPNYRVEYLNSRFYEDEGGRHRIRIAGKAFMQVALSVIPGDEEQLKLRDQKDFIPKGRLKLPSVWEVDEATWFEGYYDFLLGIGARKPFRVSELSDPLRLVIDFKH
jgi:hypothetical protein